MTGRVVHISRLTSNGYIQSATQYRCGDKVSKLPTDVAVWSYGVRVCLYHYLHQSSVI